MGTYAILFKEELNRDLIKRLLKVGKSQQKQYRTPEIEDTKYPCPDVPRSPVLKHRIPDPVRYQRPPGGTLCSHKGTSNPA